MCNHIAAIMCSLALATLMWWCVACVPMCGHKKCLVFFFLSLCFFVLCVCVFVCVEDLM